MLSEELQNFLWNTKQPWFRLAYKLYWSQLESIVDAKNLKILDFGSGFGAMANYLAKNNEVTAIEPNADMIEERECENNYMQIHGTIEKLKDLADGYFDVIVCHNVLEFAITYNVEPAEIVKEFSRIIKSGGILSIIKHNKPGRAMRSAVLYNNPDEAMLLLGEGESAHNAFGKLNFYEPEDLTKWGDNIKIEEILGVQTFYGLQQNDDAKYAPDWIDKMFELEMKVCDLEPYKSIAFANHILLRKL